MVPSVDHPIPSQQTTLQGGPHESPAITPSAPRGDDFGVGPAVSGLRRRRRAGRTHRSTRSVLPRSKPAVPPSCSFSWQQFPLRCGGALGHQHQDDRARKRPGTSRSDEAAELAAIGNVDVLVENPGNGGGMSSVQVFAVMAPAVNPVPTLASLEPDQAPTGRTGVQFDGPWQRLCGRPQRCGGAGIRSPLTFVRRHDHDGHRVGRRTRRQ